MTVDSVLAAVKAIEAVRGDDERAHGMEDELHQGVLKAIATGECEDPQECARAALLTYDLKFERWCA